MSVSVGRRTYEADATNVGDVLGLDGLGLRARVFPLRRGTWDSASEPVLRGRRRPLLLVDGVVLHIVTVRGREGAELLGPGDLIPVDDDTETFAARDRVLVPGGFTVIDERVLVSAAAQPHLLGAFGEAAIRQAGQLAGQVVLAQQVAIDDRLRILLPSLAERWGRVTSDGV